MSKTNPHITAIPCHRVVASNGQLTDYSIGEGVKTKREILEAEGVVFIGDKVNLKKSKCKGSIIL